MPTRRSRIFVCAALSVTAVGCGPELRPLGPPIETGYYQAAWIAADSACAAVWWALTPEGTGPGFTLEGIERQYADPVPLRADGRSLAVPEPGATVTGPPDPPWRMKTLSWDGSIYTGEASYHLTQCDAVRQSWSAVALDEQTLVATRDMVTQGCHEPALCDAQVDIEFVLVQSCAPPCRIVGDAQELGDDVIPRTSHCAC